MCHYDHLTVNFPPPLFLHALASDDLIRQQWSMCKCWMGEVLLLNVLWVRKRATTVSGETSWHSQMASVLSNGSEAACSTRGTSVTGERAIKSSSRKGVIVRVLISPSSEMVTLSKERDRRGGWFTTIAYSISATNITPDQPRLQLVPYSRFKSLSERTESDGAERCEKMPRQGGVNKKRFPVAGYETVRSRRSDRFIGLWFGEVEILLPEIDTSRMSFWTRGKECRIS